MRKHNNVFGRDRRKSGRIFLKFHEDGGLIWEVMGTTREGSIQCCKLKFTHSLHTSGLSYSTLTGIDGG